MKPLQTRLRASSILVSLICVILLATAGWVVFSHTSLVKASNTLTFTPVADSYVNQSDPSANFGTNKSIRVDGSPQVHSYLRFEVNGISNSPVTKVTLRIYANSASSRGFEVYKVADNNWQEKQITYNNAPSYGDKIGTSTKFPANQWVEVEVSPLLSADGTVSIAITGINETAINLASRDDNNHKPELLVEVSADADPIATSTNPPDATATNPPLPSATATNPTDPTATNPSLPSATASNPLDPTATNTPLPSATDTNPPAPSATPPLNNYQPGFPIRAVFAYPWFPEAWNQQGYNPFTNYSPSLGFYDSSSVSVIQNHISAMTYGNFSAAILSWWGQGSRTDQRVATMLGATPGSSNPNFRWTLYYENESKADPAIEQIEGDLQYIQAHYGNDPSYLRVNGKFVVFVYADGLDACGMADRWVQADNALGHPAYIVLKVFSGYRNCGSQPDNWHQYSPAVATDEQRSYSYAISPGFWKKGETNPRLQRNLTTWTSNVKSMIASGEPWQLVTTFNEWGEGTSVESAVEWASASGFGQYLDVLHDNGNGAPPAQPTATTQPTNPAGPTATPTQTTTLPPNPSPTPTRTQTPPANPTAAPTQSPGNDPILFYTSDLVSGSSVDRGQAVVNLITNLMAQHPGTQMLVASGGDNEQENSPTLSNYQSYFGTTFGTFVSQGIFMQVRGNHDIQSQGSYTDFNGNVHSTGAAYWDYFGPNAHMFNIEGQKLTDYSYDLGSWHIIALDQLNGSVNNASLNFLTSDLAAHADKSCQLVYWHVPTYSSGAAHGDSTGLKPLNQAEYNAGVDIQLGGHDHDYQRFYPINPNGVRDDAKGITTFVAGIGGQDGRTGSQTSIAQAASAIYLDTFPGGAGHAIGAIQFVLHTNSADYTLYDANDGSILDQGTVICH
jgi:hypothetical protein